MALHAIKKDDCLPKRIGTSWRRMLWSVYPVAMVEKLYNILEILYYASPPDQVIITNELVADAVQQNMSRYDKGGDLHYDMISAMIKSIRG
jgi:replication-associated recombination protein RarA